ncbi:MAG: hypothetical protein AAF735_08575 [Myxococcota bacterium]
MFGAEYGALGPQANVHGRVVEGGDLSAGGVSIDVFRCCSVIKITELLGRSIDSANPAERAYFHRTRAISRFDEPIRSRRAHRA